jgi:hypothetical protein
MRIVFSNNENEDGSIFERGNVTLYEEDFVKLRNLKEKINKNYF